MKPLNETQVKALAALVLDASAPVAPATLSKLRKMGLVGKRVERPSAANGHRQKTTSPVTHDGCEMLRAVLS